MCIGGLGPSLIFTSIIGRAEPVAGRLRVVAGAAACAALFVLSSMTAVAEAPPAFAPPPGETAQAAADRSLGQLLFVPAQAKIVVAVPGQAPDIAAALSAIGNWRMGSGAFVTIEVAPGTYDQTGSIIVDHPEGRSIGIAASGPAPSLRFVALAGIVAGQQGRYDVTLQLASTDGLKVGDYLRITATAGAGLHEGLQGLFETVALDTSSVTLRSQNAIPDPAGITLTAATIFKPAVQLRFPKIAAGSEFFGLDIRTALGNLDNIAIIGDGASPYSSGVRIGDAAYLVTGTGGGTGGLSVAHWGRNCLWAFRNATVIADGVTVSDCATNGVQALQGAQIEAARGIATGSTFGFTAVNGGQITCAKCLAAGNRTNFMASSGGVLTAPHSLAIGSGPSGAGYSARPGGFIWAADARARGNQSGFLAEGGRIYAPKAIAADNETYQIYPPLNHDSASGGGIFDDSAEPPSVEGCGAGSAVYGTDNAGNIVINGEATSCRIGFRAPFIAAPSCLVFNEEGAAVAHKSDRAGLIIPLSGKSSGARLNYRCSGM